MICPSCGNDNQPGASYCVRCGRQLSPHSSALTPDSGALQYDEFQLEMRHDGEIEATHTNRDGVRTTKKSHLELTDHQCRRLDYDLEQLRENRLQGDGRAIRLLGEELYNALFPNVIGGLFEEAERAARIRPSRHLRVRIGVDSRCTQVVHWPLEFLRCTAGDGFFLAVQRNLTLSRRISFTDQSYAPPTLNDPPLRVLVVVSRPQELGGVLTTTLEDIAKWASELGASSERPRLPARPVRTTGLGTRRPLVLIRVLGILERHEEVPTVEYLNEPATFDAFGRQVRDWSPHVLHFMGHGKLGERDDQGWLAFVSADEGQAIWRSSDHLSELLAGCYPQRPHLVILQACQSAQSAPRLGFMSLAEHLIRRNTPAVVAMQFEISNAHAVSFARAFYRALARGLEVDAAVQAGREGISLQVHWNERHFGAPVLYMLTPSSIIRPVSALVQQAQEQGLGIAIGPLPPGAGESIGQPLKLRVARETFDRLQGTLLAETPVPIQPVWDKDQPVIIARPGQIAGSKAHTGLRMKYLAELSDVLESGKESDRIKMLVGDLDQARRRLRAQSSSPHGFAAGRGWK